MKHPDADEDLWKKELEIVLIEHAELHNLSPEVIASGSTARTVARRDDLPITVGVIQRILQWRRCSQTRI